MWSAFVLVRRKYCVAASCGPVRIAFASATVIRRMASPKTVAATGTACSAARFIVVTNASASASCFSLRNVWSTFCRLAGIGIFTLRLVRNPPLVPSCFTARSVPFASASLSAFAVWSSVSAPSEGSALVATAFFFSSSSRLNCACADWCSSVTRKRVRRIFMRV